MESSRTEVIRITRLSGFTADTFDQYQTGAFTGGLPKTTEDGRANGVRSSFFRRLSLRSVFNTFATLCALEGQHPLKVAEAKSLEGNFAGVWWGGTGKTLELRIIDPKGGALKAQTYLLSERF